MTPLLTLLGPGVLAAVLLSAVSCEGPGDACDRGLYGAHLEVVYVDARHTSDICYDDPRYSGLYRP